MASHSCTYIAPPGRYAATQTPDNCQTAELRGAPAQ